MLGLHGTVIARGTASTVHLSGDQTGWTAGQNLAVMMTERLERSESSYSTITNTHRSYTYTHFFIYHVCFVCSKLPMPSFIEVFVVFNISVQWELNPSYPLSSVEMTFIFCFFVLLKICTAAFFFFFCPFITSVIFLELGFYFVLFFPNGCVHVLHEVHSTLKAVLRSVKAPFL